MRPASLGVTEHLEREHVDRVRLLDLLVLILIERVWRLVRQGDATGPERDVERPALVEGPDPAGEGSANRGGPILLAIELHAVLVGFSGLEPVDGDDRLMVALNL